MMKKQLILLGYLVFTSCLVRAQLEQFQCEKEGFAIVQSTNCSSYYYCVISGNNEFYAIEYKCPSGEEFSLVLLKCIPKEENECGKLPGTMVEDPMLTEEFVCPSQGRFPDVESLDCKSYYTCTADLMPAPNTCPSVTIFSWTAMKCVMPDTFICPNSVVTTTEEPTTTKDPDAFVCIGEGRFADPQTVDCKTYYLCAKTPSGTVEASLNQCPSTALFSPISSKCVTPDSYVCPLTVSPTSTVETPSTESAIEPSTEMPTDSESTATVELTTSELVTDDVEISTTVLPSSPESSSTTEVSTQEQTTVTDNDTTVESTTDLVTESTVEQTTEVSSQEQTAGETTETVELTTADMTKETTVTETASTEEVTQSVSVTDIEEQSTIQTSTSETTTEAVITPEPSGEETTVSATTPAAESTTIDSTTKEPSESFICTGKGRYPDPTSSDCKSYYLCSENDEGFIEATLNQCPTVTVFDSINLKCVLPTDYQCSQGISTTTGVTEGPTTTEVTTQETPPSVSFVCPSSGRFPDLTSTDCKRYYLCSGTGAGTYEALLTQCPGTTLFSLESNRCVLSTQYQCPTNMPNPTPVVPPTTEAIISTTMPSIDTDKFSCKSVGGQPDPSQSDCKKYKYCLLTATNEFLEYTFYCPEGTYFDPTNFKCSISYNCQPPQTTNAAAEPTAAVPFVCTTNGRFSDPLSAGCEAYIMCLIAASGDILQYNFECPKDYRFNPKEAKCVSDYDCV